MAKTLLIPACFFILLEIVFGCKNEPSQINVDVFQRKSDLVFNLNFHQQKLNNLAYYRIEEYPYITDLGDGYKLDYQVDTTSGQWIQYVMLINNKKLVDTLSGMSYGLKFRNLGYVSYIADDVLIYSNSFGFWDACPSKIIEKGTGELLSWGFYVSVDTVNERYFYTKNDFLKASDTLFCYDFNTTETKFYQAPANVLGSSEELGTSKVDLEEKGYFMVNSIDERLALKEIN